MVPGSVKYQQNEEGRKTGHAAVLFESCEDAERAFKEKQSRRSVVAGYSSTIATSKTMPSSSP